MVISIALDIQIFTLTASRFSMQANHATISQVRAFASLKVGTKLLLGLLKRTILHRNKLQSDGSSECNWKFLQHAVICKVQRRNVWQCQLHSLL